MSLNTMSDKDDCIGRQAAIDVLHGYFDGMLETDTWSPCDVYGLIEILPSVQPDLSEYSDKLWKSAYERGKAEAQDARWIPVSERLPDVGREIIFCDVDGDIFVGHRAREHWWSVDDKVKNVVAWMPLPNPYKGGETE